MRHFLPYTPELNAIETQWGAIGNASGDRLYNGTGLDGKVHLNNDTQKGDRTGQDERISKALTTVCISLFCALRHPEASVVCPSSGSAQTEIPVGQDADLKLLSWQSEPVQIPFGSAF